MIRLDRELQSNGAAEADAWGEVECLVEAVDELTTLLDTQREVILGALTKIIRRRSAVERLRHRCDRRGGARLR